MMYWSPSPEVSEWLSSHYADESGTLVFRVSRKPVKLTVAKSGHRVLTIRNSSLHLRRQVYAHRLMYFLHHRHFPASRLDHEDLDKSNNQVENLRLVTSRQNNTNVPKRKQYAGRSPSSKYKGVSWHKQANKWVAQIHVNKRNIHLGLFDDELEAARAYDDAVSLYNGDYGRGNT